MATHTSTHHVTVVGDQVHKRFVRWDRGEAEREWQCLVLLAEHAPGVAPRPLRREVRDGAPVVVMQRLPGTPLDDTPLTPAQRASLGDALLRVHAVPLDAVHAAGVGERLVGPTRQVAHVAAWLAEPRDLSTCRDPALVALAVARARAWLAEPGSTPEPRLSCLGTADGHPANVLWDGTRCRLVDLEDGGLSEPAYELADRVEHLAGRLRASHDVEGLVAAAGLAEDEQVRMQAYRPLWAAFWLAMVLPGSRGHARNPPGTAEAQAAHVLALLG